MLRKKLQLIVSFHTTADALLCERLCKREGIAGRLIPVPREISAGCGHAWMCEPEAEERLRALFAAEGLDAEEMQTLMY